MENVGPLVKIENVVASATLRHGIDLGDVVRAFPKMKYHPNKFPGLVFRLRNPRTAILIFSSGKMVCTGAKSVSEVRRALRTVVRKLKNAGIVILGKLSTKIQNIVASANLGGTVDLVRLYESQRSDERIAESWCAQAPRRRSMCIKLSIGFVKNWRKTSAYFTQNNKSACIEKCLMS